MAPRWRYDDPMGKKRALSVWEASDSASEEDPYSYYDKSTGRLKGSRKVDRDAALREEVFRWITALIVLILILAGFAGVSKEWFPS